MADPPTPSTAPVHLSGYRFEPLSGQLWSGTSRVRLRPKAARVLSVLIEHAGQVIGKERLLAEVWPDGFVGDAALAVCVNELRQAFGDDSRAPRVIATVHRRGYQLVAPLSGRPSRTAADTVFVGRAAERATIRGWWRAADEGHCTVGFVEGDAGAGKSALLQRVVDDLGREHGAAVAWASCVHQHDGGEPYRPVLDALADLAGGPDRRAVRDVLATSAPSWLQRLRGLPEGGAAAPPTHPAGTGAPAGLARELATALDLLTRDRTLVVVLEDLQEADRSTADLLGYLARRRSATRLLLLGSYRRAGPVASEHGVRAVIADLRARQRGHSVALAPLTGTEIEAYLTARLAPRRPAPRLVEEVGARTEGHPLFLAGLTDLLIAQNLVRQEDPDLASSVPDQGPPEDFRRLVEHLLDALAPADGRLLAVAATVGREFTVAEVAAGLDADDVDVEERLGLLARSTGLLVRVGLVAWPDRTPTVRYRLTHAGYRQPLLDRWDGPARRAVTRRRIADRARGGRRPTDDPPGPLKHVITWRERDGEQAAPLRTESGAEHP